MARKKQDLSLEERLEQALVPESEQPYKVPENWVWTKLDNIVSITTGKKDANYGTVNGKYLFFTCAAEPIRCEGFSFEGESILLAGNGANVGLALYYNGQFEAYQRTYVIQAKDKLPLKYVFYHFIGFWKEYNADKQYGTATNYIKLGNFQEYPIPLPPLVEQQRIVDRIESLFEKLDQAKGLIQDALDSFEKRKAAILHLSFSGELTKKWREENGMGLKVWNEKKLKDCGKWFGGGTPSKKVSDFWDDGDIMWVTPKDMKSKYIHDAIDHITNMGLQESSVTLIDKPAVLFVVRSGILRRTLPIAITLQKVTINQDMKAIIPNQIELEYLYWFCVCNEKDIRDSCSKSGTTVESINTKSLYNYPILIPSIPEQQAIVNILNDLFEKEQNAGELSGLIENIDLMKKSILARAFRGELGTNDPAEESALELLREVLTH